MNSELAIQVTDLTKIYKLYERPVDRLKETLHPFRKKYHRNFHALNNVSFDVPKGETLGIIGQNGSGKSTLLKALTGVLSPTSGDIVIGGKVSALLELGTGFNPELTGVENVYFNGALQGYARSEMAARLDSILSFADIGDFINQPIKMYSSGMLVRLAFAAAINIDPDILIVDEALAVGDIRFQRKCYAKFEEFRNAGKTIIFVSHGLDTINLLCDRAILLNSGRVQEQGAPKYVTMVYQKMMLGVDIGNDRTDRILGRELVSEQGNLEGEYDTDAGLETTNDVAVTGSKKAEIIDYCILDRFGKRVALLESGERYTIMSRVLFHQDVKQIHVGYPIKNTKGLLVFAVNSPIQRVKIEPQQKGSILEGRVEVTMWLAPGDYFLSFRVFAFDEVYDMLPDALHFVVTGACDQLSGSIVNLTPRLSVHYISNINNTTQSILGRK
jgi:teichoic acid transport system ATP-binding protein